MMAVVAAAIRLLRGLYQLNADCEADEITFKDHDGDGVM